MVIDLRGNRIVFQFLALAPERGALCQLSATLVHSMGAVNYYGAVVGVFIRWVFAVRTPGEFTDTANY